MAHRLVSCIWEIESKRGNQNPRGLLCYDLKQSRMDSRGSHLTTLERCNVSLLAWYLPKPGSVVGRKDQKGEKRRGWNSKNWRGKRAQWWTLSPPETTALLVSLADFFFLPRQELLPSPIFILAYFSICGTWSQVFLGSFYVSVKLPTYPSPKPTFCPK